MTRTQKTTVILLIVYFLYEYFLMRPWASGNDSHIIRFDLLLIIPVLSFFVIKSIVQLFIKKKKHTSEVITVDQIRGQAVRSPEESQTTEATAGLTAHREKGREKNLQKLKD